MSTTKGKSAPDLWDLRVRARYIEDGTVNQADLDKHLASLPDVEAQAEALEIPQPGITGDDDDEADQESPAS